MAGAYVPSQVSDLVRLGWAFLTSAQEVLMLLGHLRPYWFFIIIIIVTTIANSSYSTHGAPSTALVTRTL